MVMKVVYSQSYGFAYLTVRADPATVLETRPWDMVVISVESLSIYSQIDLIIKLASFIHSIIIH